jgi:mannonate dehydratase
MSGVDEALWDIKGRQAGLPVYQLLGGKCREAAACYTHISGAEIQEIVDKAKKAMSEGFRHIRLQIAIPGMAAYGSRRGGERAESLHHGEVFEPKPYMLRSLKMLEACRKELGDDIELLHDMHERVTPSQAVQFARDVEPFKLFFLEDPLSPEDIDYFRLIRQKCATPIAMGELFNSPHEWRPLIAERLIDFIRIHVSQAGGLTPCRKIAATAEQFGVQTAWHGPGDVSPVGHAANLALDLACYNFGIQEGGRFTPEEKEIFQGSPELKGGYLYANERPGWGIEVDETLAAKFPFGGPKEGSRGLNGGWGEIRRLDGTIIKQ